MEHQHKNVWVSTEDLNNDPAFLQSTKQEFFELPIVEALQQDDSSTATNRRDFLKYLGFGLSAATLASACRIPVKKAIPYVTKPDAIVPGVANYYASSIVDGGDYCAVLVKTREARPIKIEGNNLSTVTWGGTSARVQAAVLSLYDKRRFQHGGKVKADGIEKMAWADLDKTVKSNLTPTSQIRIISNTVMSPSAKRAVAEFIAKYPNTKHIQYDAVSSAGILLANEACFGMRVIPNYKFQDAEVIASFGADFLGTWISPIEYAAQYIKNRKIDDVKSAKMSRHYHLESGMSMTGSNADHRILIKPSETGAALLHLYAAVGGTGVSPQAINPKALKAIQVMAADLKAAAGKSLVISGSNDVNEQIIVNAINNLLGNIGTTIDFAEYSNQRQGIDKDIIEVVKEQVDAVFIWGANPVYDLPNGKAFGEWLKRAKLSVSFHNTMNETTALCKYSAPDHHILESWGDVEPKNGKYSLVQPTIAPIFATRQAPASLLVWAESANYLATAEQPYLEYVKSTCEQTIFAKQSKFASFRSFWDSTLHDGVFESTPASAGVSYTDKVAEAAPKIQAPATGMEVSFYETVQMGDGRYATNPWLQEMPDPVTRCVWDNHVCIPIEWDNNQTEFKGLNNLKDGDLVNVTINGQTLLLNVVRQFGQMKNTISIALGYGRSNAGHKAYEVGANVFPFVAAGETFKYSSAKVTVGATPAYAKDARSRPANQQFACVQLHHTYGITSDQLKDEYADEKTLGWGNGFKGALTDRSVMFQTDMHELPKFTEELKEKRAEFQARNAQGLYPDHADKYKAGLHWGMSIDMNACTGCGACTIACMAENNVPVVGKFEIARAHEMSWLRIDRYFYGDAETPNTVYQPMMCQHCDAAPCENVCPVSATNHSSEGLNQMTYNRCIGTRYCANNCPFKVRRFNWMDYTSADNFGANENKLYKDSMFGGEEGYMEDNLTRMVLNPDVTVRVRGVIEKCSFCVQRIQEGKLTAKRENRAFRDNDVRSACQTACPTGAIKFGNTNDENSEVSRHRQNDLAYIVIEEINVKPNVVYRTKVTNKNTKLDA